MCLAESRGTYSSFWFVYNPGRTAGLSRSLIVSSLALRSCVAHICQTMTLPGLQHLLPAIVRESACLQERIQGQFSEEFVLVPQMPSQSHVVSDMALLFVHSSHVASYALILFLV